MSSTIGFNSHRSLPPVEPAQPPAEQAEPAQLKDIRQLLSEQNIDMLLRNPDAPVATQLLAQLRRSINKDTLNLLRRNPSAHTTKALSAIGTLLSESAVNKRMSESLGAYVRNEAKQYERTRFDNLLQLSLADPEAAWDMAQGIWNGLQASIQASQAHASYIRNTAHTLKGLGELFQSGPGQ